MEYFPAYDMELKLKEIINKLGMNHIDATRIACFRSKGTSAKNIIARCHGLPKIQQLAMKTAPFYVIELISENFEKLNEDEKIKTLIHELMHIPRNFGGGFRHHDFVTRKNVDILYDKFLKNDTKIQI